MATRRLFAVLVVSVSMLMVTLTAGIAGAAPVDTGNKCVAAAPALHSANAPALKRYAAYKEAQIERMDSAVSFRSAQADCAPQVESAAKVVRRSHGYAAFKDQQAGN